MTAAVRLDVLVNASPDRAFELFVGRIGDWWPLSVHSVFGTGTVGFEGSRIVERLGEHESLWGEVTTWSPPSEIRFTWHPGHGPEHATDVRVTFEAQGGQTLVVLVHTGWERMTDPDATAEEYRHGWVGVLSRYAELVTSGRIADLG
jgi:uncharacterized protein YndB with AHSA1/START domain